MLQLVAKRTPSARELRESQLSQKRFQLAKLLRCTEKMLSCAKKGDWELVEEIEKSRKPEIMACFSDHSCGDSYGDTPLISEALATLIDLNEQISKLVKEARTEVMMSRRNLENSKSVVKLYEENLEI